MSSRGSRRPREGGSREDNAEDLRVVHDLRSYARDLCGIEAEMSEDVEDCAFAWEEDFSESIEEYVRSYTQELEGLEELTE